MKRTGMISAVLILWALSLNCFAQQSSDYFLGKWGIIGGGPQGDVTFTMQLERIEGVLVGNIQREGETNPIKFSKVQEKENEITVYFQSSSGNDVDFLLKKKDENSLEGTAMGMYKLTGKRIKQ